MEEHLGCFHILALVNNAAINIGCMYFFKIMFLLSWGKYPVVELLGHMVVILFLIIWGTSMLFSQWLFQFALPPIVQGFPISPHPWQYFFSLVLLILVILTGVKCYTIMVWICISLMISDVDHLFMCLLGICMFVLEKICIQVFSSFFIWIICWFLLLKCLSSLYIFNISPLLDISFANIFSHSIGCFLILLMVLFTETSLFFWYSLICFCFRCLRRHI